MSFCGLLALSAPPLTSGGCDQLEEPPCGRGVISLIYNHMVVDLVGQRRRQQHQEDDRLFHALADGTRRDIVARTMRAEHSVSALARLYPMSFAAVQKHVAVLEGAGLVTKRRRGREQLVSGNVQALRRAAGLLDQLEALWRSRIDRFGEILAEDPSEGAPT